MKKYAFIRVHQYGKILNKDIPRIKYNNYIHVYIRYVTDRLFNIFAKSLGFL